jgi:hypothetical protein
VIITASFLGVAVSDPTSTDETSCDLQSEAVRTAPSLTLHVAALPDTGTLVVDDSTVATHHL